MFYMHQQLLLPDHDTKYEENQSSHHEDMFNEGPDTFLFIPGFRYCGAENNARCHFHRKNIEVSFIPVCQGMSGAILLENGLLYKVREISSKISL